MTRYVYFARRQSDTDRYTLVKIGIANDPVQRCKDLGVWLIFAVGMEEQLAKKTERALHSELRSVRWPQLGHSTEWFECNHNLLVLIRAVLNRHRWPWDHSAELIIT